MKDSEVKNGGPAFPMEGFGDGMSLRDYFAIHGPEPLDSDVQFQRQLDRNKNPHNESQKPKLRSDKEIRAALRYEFADAMLEARK